DAGGRFNAEGGVIVGGVVDVGAAVDDFVALGGQLFFDVVFRFKSSMVCSEVNAHAQDSSEGTGRIRPRPRQPARTGTGGGVVVGAEAARGRSVLHVGAVAAPVFLDHLPDQPDAADHEQDGQDPKEEAEGRDE